MPNASFNQPLRPILAATQRRNRYSSHEKYATPNGECLNAFFWHLSRTRADGMRDPEGVAGIVPMAPTAAARERVKSAAQHASEHSAAALYAESRGDLHESLRQWQIVFNRLL